MTQTPYRNPSRLFYRTTILSGETDPNKLHGLKSDLDGYQVYSQEQIDNLIELYLDGADRDKLDPILDACVATYNADLDEDGQVNFNGKAKTFVRTYGFLSAIFPYSFLEWEKLSIFSPYTKTSRTQRGKSFPKHFRNN